MVAAAVRMRTPSAMFMSRGAASLRRPQVSYKFQEVIQYVCSQASRMKRATQLTPFLPSRRSQLPALASLSRFYASKCMIPT